MHVRVCTWLMEKINHACLTYIYININIYIHKSIQTFLCIHLVIYIYIYIVCVCVVLHGYTWLRMGVWVVNGSMLDGH